MYYFILTVHVIACVGLILVVLLQAGKGSGISGLFGGGGADQLFSAPSGMAFIKKATIVMAVVFTLTSLILTVSTSRRGLGTVTGQIPAIPVTPGQ
ncbi:MAG: preprotein translocase subunit SecG [Elusimicrobia bacterium RIFOXYA2_FULL_50_26]|nr:MAG: preprotein translocase subunit SecG [Elusimicrobia bacterium RIFOXYA2_FULL_50_26]